MSTKVLVFESDPAFAGELRTEFDKLGCFTTVVEDGNLGLQQAVADPPDLILLSIELPRMNGFSVCNKLKKDPSLKDVPLIIMSSESSDETFEQHKKLRTRAQDYVHKPIAFGELLLHIQGFVPMASMLSDSDGTIVIEDEIEIASTDYVADDANIEVSGESPRAAATARRIETVDADVDAFAESAFGRLTGTDVSVAQGYASHNGAMLGEPVHAVGHVGDASSVAPRPPSVRSPAVGTMGVDRAQYESVRDELARVKERFDEVDGAFEEARAELERLRAEVSEGERRAHEIEELKSKLAVGAKGAAASSREFLDLREALNRKDKELLTLKELSSKKDRLIVEAQDRALAAERAHADVDERLLLLEREFGEMRETNESLLADRDLAKKASEDFRTRLEKSRTDGEAKERQLTELKARHAEELIAVEENFAATRAQIDQTLANERADHARALDQAEERRRDDLEQLRRDHGAQLATAHNEWKEESERARIEAEHQAHAALDALRTDLQSRAARELGEANDQATRLAHELTAVRDELTTLRQGKDEIESKMAVAEARIASVEAEVAAARRELIEAKQRLMGESARADKSEAKWHADRESLERAKDALAVALAQIEEAEQRRAE
ncbi:MAG: response regulator [Myxococcota bacterium]|nr:response regulator [Myxococcota bacterium]